MQMPTAMAGPDLGVIAKDCQRCVRHSTLRIANTRRARARLFPMSSSGAGNVSRDVDAL
jgi:hypothetical protein